MRGRWYDPEDIPQESIAALNDTLVCSVHDAHPSLCGCDYDPIGATEAAEIWNEGVANDFVLMEFDIDLSL